MPPTKTILPRSSRSIGKCTSTEILRRNSRKFVTSGNYHCMFFPGIRRWHAQASSVTPFTLYVRMVTSPLRIPALPLVQSKPISINAGSDLGVSEPFRRNRHVRSGNQYLAYLRRLRTPRYSTYCPKTPDSYSSDDHTSLQCRSTFRLPPVTKNFFGSNI